MAKIDPTQDVPAPSQGDLANVTRTAQQMIAAAAEVEKAEADLARKKAELFRLQQVELPDLMNGIGLKDFRLVTGQRIFLRDIVQASLPAAGAIAKAKGEEKDLLIQRLTDGLNFLRANNAADLIKSVVTILFGKGQDASKQELAQELRQKGLDVEEADMVHPQTLAAWVKEARQKGIPIPEETLGVFIGQKAEVK